MCDRHVRGEWLLLDEDSGIGGHAHRGARDTAVRARARGMMAVVPEARPAVRNRGHFPSPKQQEPYHDAEQT